MGSVVGIVPEDIAVVAACRMEFAFDSLEVGSFGLARSFDILDVVV